MFLRSASTWLFTSSTWTNRQSGTQVQADPDKHSSLVTLIIVSVEFFSLSSSLLESLELELELLLESLELELESLLELLLELLAVGSTTVLGGMVLELVK